MAILDTINSAYNERGRIRQVALNKQCHPTTATTTTTTTATATATATATTSTTNTTTTTNDNHNDTTTTTTNDNMPPEVHRLLLLRRHEHPHVPLRGECHVRLRQGYFFVSYFIYMSFMFTTYVFICFYTYFFCLNIYCLCVLESATSVSDRDQGEPLV